MFINLSMLLTVPRVEVSSYVEFGVVVSAVDRTSQVRFSAVHDFITILFLLLRTNYYLLLFSKIDMNRLSSYEFVIV